MLFVFVILGELLGYGNPVDCTNGISVIKISKIKISKSAVFGL